MAETTKKNFSSPEDTRNVDKGKVEVLNLSSAQVMRATFQPVGSGQNLLSLL
jgi:hypothetical protein